MIGWLLRLPFMPRWIGRTAWFKRRFCMCGQRAQAAALRQGRPVGGREWFA